VAPSVDRRDSWISDLHLTQKGLELKEKANKENNKDSKKKISQGILKKIDIAFSLAFLFINKEFSIKPLNMLILDSLHNFDNKDIKLLLRDLSKKNGYQILIFNTEKPSNLTEKSSKIVEIIRNQLMRKPDTFKHITKQYNLTRFF